MAEKGKTGSAEEAPAPDDAPQEATAAAAMGKPTMPLGVQINAYQQALLTGQAVGDQAMITQITRALGGLRAEQQLVAAPPGLVQAPADLFDEAGAVIPPAERAADVGAAARRRDYAKENKEVRGNIAQFAKFKPFSCIAITTVILEPLTMFLNALLRAAGAGWDLHQAAAAAKGKAREYRILNAYDGKHDRKCASFFLQS